MRATKLLGSVTAALALSGCALVLGIEEQTYDGAGGGATTGSGGATTGSGGATTGSGGAGGAGGLGGTGGTGGGTIGTIGEACSPANALACAGHAQKLVLYCDPSTGNWTALQSCTGQQLCDTRPGSSQGSCQDPVPLCIGKSPGDKLCDGGDAVECGPDLVTSTTTTCPYVCVDGACTGECSPGSRQCEGATPEACDSAGTWQSEASCAYACTGAGECTGTCAPGTKQCAGLVPQTCDAAGSWQSGAACPGVCTDGACESACTNGNTQCSNKTLQTCVSGAWQDTTTCPYLCASGACSGDCVPDAKQCAGAGNLVPQTCDASGAWQSGAACSFVCSSGACGGSCVPGAKKCNGLQPQQCDASGTWQNDGGACTYVCQDASATCTGDCSPGGLRCTGQQPQKCDSSGTWQNNGTPCPNVCSAGACAGACSPGAKQCNGLVVQTCDVDGIWQNTSTCPYLCSSGACSGSCVPNTKQCMGLVPQNCDANGAWQSGSACSSSNGTASCAGGLCSIACNSGYDDCDGNVANGCEVSTSASSANCGACNRACASANVAAPACSASLCTSTCAAGYGNCNKPAAPSADDGCETSTSADPKNCGGCGVTCTNVNGTTECSSGVCSPSCSSGYGNCDGNAVNGCETDFQTSNTHCGACGNACSGGKVCSDGICVTTTPLSCIGGATGQADCGPNSESCCTSLAVPGGTVQLDASHTATVSDFKLDKYEITVGRFRKFVDAWVDGWRPTANSGKHTHLNSGQGLSNGSGGFEPGWDASWSSSFKATKPEWDDVLTCNGNYETWTSGAGANEKRPIICATWFEQYAFCIWDGGFLPSEAEWQYAAAGGGENRKYPWGATTPTDTLAVFCGGSCSSTQNVGNKPAGNGRWGHSDLAGNVWEWTLDWYVNPYPLLTSTNYANTTIATDRVFRGGSFSLGASYLLASDRNNFYPSIRYSIGARCLRTP